MKTICITVILLLLATCCVRAQVPDSSSPPSLPPPSSAQIKDLYRQLGGFESLWRKNVEERVLLEKNIENIRIMIRQEESKEKVEKPKPLEKGE